MYRSARTILPADKALRSQALLPSVARVEHCGQVRINSFERAESSVQIAPYKFSKERFVTWETDAQRSHSARVELMRQHLKLRALPRTVDPFQCN